MSLVTVYPFTGSKATKAVIIQPGMKYIDAYTGKELSGPAKFGDVSPTGVPYRVGVLSELGNRIAYYDSGSGANSTTSFSQKTQSTNS